MPKAKAKAKAKPKNNAKPIRSFKHEMVNVSSSIAKGTSPSSPA